MLVVLPPLLTSTVFLYILQNHRTLPGKLALLRAISYVGFYAVGILEVLNLVSGITQIYIAIAWIFPLFLTLGFLLYKHNQGIELRFPKINLPRGSFEATGYAIIILILLCTALVAYYAPPQTWDSLNYRMSRVAHWAQDRSLEPFATGIEIQNSYPPGAELLFLHAYLLAGGDQFVNFVQWFAMIGSVIAVLCIAELLGVKPIGYVITAVFALTLPMGIIQASSTMNDYVVTLWVTSFAYEALHYYQSEGEHGSMVMMSLTASMAILTKPTAYPYLLPFALIVIFMFIKTAAWKTMKRPIITALLIVAILNTPHLSRTYKVYGAIYDPQPVRTQSNQAKNLAGLLSTTLRNLSLHLGTPFPHVNKGIFLLIEGIHDVLGIDINDPRTTVHADFKINKTNTNEIKAGNPLHMYSFFLVLLYLLSQRKRGDNTLLWFSVLCLSTLFVFSLIFKWQLFASRYHITFFILISPIFGVVISKIQSDIWRWGYLVTFSLLSIPWLSGIESRPLIPGKGTVTWSILEERREASLFGSSSEYIKPYERVTQSIIKNQCTDVGIALSGHAAEYPFWFLLGAPRDDLTIEWIVDGSFSAKFRNQSFVPCAVICDRSCPQDWQVVNDLPLKDETAGYRLFMGGGEH
jgi:4-amino-4-deoxy-L-arabinose transferase-like glycosyltransferase